MGRGNPANPAWGGVVKKKSILGLDHYLILKIQERMISKTIYLNLMNMDYKLHVRLNGYSIFKIEKHRSC